MTTVPGSEAYGVKFMGAPTITDEAQGRVQADFCTFDDVDNDGEVTLSGAIDDGMKCTVSSYNHDTVMGQMLGTGIPDQPPVGKGVIRVVGKKAVADLQYFMETQRGREAFLTVKAMGPDARWSYAFRKTQVAKPTPEWEAKGARKLLVKLGPLLDGAMEVSPVKMPAGKGTATLSVKSAQPTASVDGTEHPAEDFAYVPDAEKPSTWKLPIFDANHVRNALARLYQADIPSDALPAVRKRILAAAARFCIDAASLERKAAQQLDRDTRDRLFLAHSAMARTLGGVMVAEGKRHAAERLRAFFGKSCGFGGPEPLIQFFAPDGERGGQFSPKESSKGYGFPGGIVWLSADLDGIELVTTAFHEFTHSRHHNLGLPQTEEVVEKQAQLLVGEWEAAGFAF